jgi:large subunit ribosomal protein L2
MIAANHPFGGGRHKRRQAKPEAGNISFLGNVPEGTMVFNIELRPGDGGRLARQAGSYAIVVGKTGDKVIVTLPSGWVRV